MFINSAIIALIPAIVVAQNCADSSSFTFELDWNKKTQNCAWLNKSANTADRISKYCAYGSVKFACQDTCGSCAATCADVPSFDFTIDIGNLQDCTWFRLNNSADRINMYCFRGDETAPKAGFEVGANCPESCGFCPTMTPDTPTPEKKPNLIFIITDEHNFRTLGCYRRYMDSIGNPDIVWGDGNYVYTPNIDKLAAEGAMFSNFYAVTPLCTPSRASFMSGLHPAFTGESNNNHGSMDGDIPTFASVLRDQGYFTSYFGKWHLGGEANPGWYDLRDNGFTNTRFRYNRGHWKYFKASMDSYDVQEYDINGEGEFAPDDLDTHYATDFLFDRGIEDIQKALDADQNFAMVLSIADPHGPNNVRPPYRTMFDDMKVKYPDSGKAAVQGIGNPRWNNVDHEPIDPNDAAAYIERYENDPFFQNYIQQYYAMVALLDANVGKLLTFLDTKGITEETIIVFTSDHGDLLGEHGKFNKGRPYETSAGVPFIIRYPTKIQNEMIIQNAYSSVDFAPTILKLMGVDHPGVTFQGVDATPEIFNSDQRVTDGDRITFTYDNQRTAVWAAAVMSGYKLVVSRSDVPWLFHYSKDPNEMINYFEDPDPQYAVVVERLQAALFDAMGKYNVPLASQTDVFFWDMPACMDSAEVVTLRSGRKIMCTDITIEEDKMSVNRCSNQSAVKTSCARACKDCDCEDSPGRLFVSGELKKCNQLVFQCDHFRVRQFCPLTCNAC